MPGLVLIGAAGLLYAAGRLVREGSSAVALLLVSSTCLAVIAAAPEMLSGTATAAPLDYGNANGALLAIGATAAVGALVLSRGWVRALAGVEAVILLIALAETRSMAATVLAMAAALLVGTSLLGRTARAVGVALAAATLLAALSATVALGVGYTGPGASESERALSDRRVDLWGDAVDLAEAHPWRGVGIGQFPVASPTARADADTRFAHSLALELAAEGGLPLGITCRRRPRAPHGGGLPRGHAGAGHLGGDGLCRAGEHRLHLPLPGRRARRRARRRPHRCPGATVIAGSLRIQRESVTP